MQQALIFTTLPDGTRCKESACQCRTCKRCSFSPYVGKIPGRREWQPTPVFLPGEFLRQRSLAGYSPWGHKESDTTDQVRATHNCFSSVQFSSVAQSCPTPCDPMNCSTPGLPVHHQLPEFTQTHVHRVSDAIQPSHPPSSPSSPAPNPSQHQSFPVSHLFA